MTCIRCHRLGALWLCRPCQAVIVARAANAALVEAGWRPTAVAGARPG